MTANVKLSMSERLALRAAGAAPVSNERVLEIPLEKIRFDESQPRKAFHAVDGSVAEKDVAYITEMAESISFKGLIQPITVRECEGGTYMVVVGECRTRAHLQLGRSTIRAIVRNDLTDESQRLLYQLAENVNRQDLTDDELAASIRDLLKGSPTAAPMLQSEIAKMLGKSEGWVTRFVKFGDEELQRLWVKSGIADTAEKLYRISILPPALQIDLRRRVDLPESDPEFLAKPLLRSVIDSFAHEAKVIKLAKKEGAKTPTPAVDMQAEAALGRREDFDQFLAKVPDVPPMEGDGMPPEDRDAVGDALGAAVVASASGGHAGLAEQVPVPPVANLATGKYELPQADRAALLESVSVSMAKGEPASLSKPVAAVKCHVSLSNLLRLVEALKADSDLSDGLDGVRCEAAFAAPLAQLVANALTGMIVSEAEVQSTLQAALGKL